MTRNYSIDLKIHKIVLDITFFYPFLIFYLHVYECIQPTCAPPSKIIYPISIYRVIVVEKSCFFQTIYV